MNYSDSDIKWAVYFAPPPVEAHYQLDHINESRVKDVLSSQIACFALATVAVILRFVSRRLSKTAIKADHWMTVHWMTVVALVRSSHNEPCYCWIVKAWKLG